MKYDYDLIVIGGGAAGLVAATGGAALGAKTALVEKSRLGGDCTWYGCVPSKALIKASELAKDGNYNLGDIMEHVRGIVRKISEHHPAEVFEKKGIKVLFGDPKFIDSKTIGIGEKKLRAKRFILATGSHALVPHIEGLSGIDYLTNENIFDLKALPESLAVLGGGPIGVELASAFSRLGVKVYIIEMLDRLLFREDPEAAKVLQDRLVKDGVEVLTGRKAVKFQREGGLTSIALEDKENGQSVVRAEKVLVAIGRRPNIEGLDLFKAWVIYSNQTIKVDNTLRTTARNIYACGDIVGPYQFSHMAEYQAIVAVGNALFPFKRKVDYRAVPWCTFTDPELAHVGMTEEEARKKYTTVKVYKSDYSKNDRAVTDLAEEGFAKVICGKNGHILGAHIVGRNAGEVIHEFVLAMSARLPIGSISSSIHIYPTLAQVGKSAADQYYTEMLESKWAKKISGFMLKLLR